MEIDHNVFRNGIYPVASFGGLVRGLNIHHNVFDGIQDIGVCLLPGFSNFRFTNNTVVVKKDMPLLGLGKHAAESKDILIADNVLVKEGVPPYPGNMVRGLSDPRAASLVVRGNLFWNWTPEGESPMTRDPLRSAIPKAINGCGSPPTVRHVPHGRDLSKSRSISPNPIRKDDHENPNTILT